MSNVNSDCLLGAPALPSKLALRILGAIEMLGLESAFLFERSTGSDVFRCLGPDGLPIAVKLLNIPCTEAEHLRRQILLRREARYLALCHSPNTPRFIAVNQEGLWIAREFVDGPTLHAACKVMGDAQRLEALRNINSMVQDLFPRFHESEGGAQVIRDFKPRNIVLDRKLGRAALVDLGATRQEGAEAQAQDGKVRLGTGKWRFWAPEQLINSEPVNRKADYFAFGSTAFFILMGRPVLRNTAPDLVSASSQFSRDCFNAARALKTSSLKLPKAYVDFLISCLEMDPAARPQNVDQLNFENVHPY